ncbi:acyl carrier protein [Rhizobium cauense]|uniref:acyl carrier protein n=1 Tax=Rhizobium cauense TaxID=1166683 RepID=UPI0009DFC2A9|nr:acyl carrier protein [Rhizobium cauense]MBW9114990.1 acyl carrier protein [Rhizobium cauense]
MEQKIRKALATHAKLDVDAGAVSVTQNLFDVGMTSFACVQLMMRLEEVFDIEFPDELMKKGTFETIDSIRHNLKDLGVRPPATGPSGVLSIFGLGVVIAAGAWREPLQAVASIAVG